ncbi:MAG TPA: LysE family translocator [Gaiellaceae bacterium]|jgi:threonine/homoserine/homoserine lactone efflux protein
MPTATTFGLFCAAALALIVVPGPAVTYVVTQSVDRGRRAGILSAFGVACGGLVHVTAATVGLSALVASSASAFTVVKLVGAAYLISIGLLRLLRGEREEPGSDPGHVRGRRLFLQGAVVNVFNPKTALFFLAFLPQFVDPNRGHVAVQIAVLGCSFVVIAVLSDSTYALVASALAGRIRGSRRATQVKRYVSGTIFVALGATAAAARR